MPMFPGAYVLHMCIECTWSGHGACGCLVAWFCYQLMARPGGGTAARLRDLTHVHASEGVHNLYVHEFMYLSMRMHLIA